MDMKPVLASFTIEGASGRSYCFNVARDGDTFIGTCDLPEGGVNAVGLTYKALLRDGLEAVAVFEEP
jgi:hypothetical protein